jgi:hypothetical protein
MNVRVLIVFMVGSDVLGADGMADQQGCGNQELGQHDG